MVAIDFFFGAGSRYSYLAATRVREIEQANGASVRWRAVYSPELIRRAGPDPFAATALRGQYAAAWRAEDAARWAALLGVPYAEPRFEGTDWRLVALWCAAAELVGDNGAFATAAFADSFGRGLPPGGDAALAGVAQRCGLRAEGLMANVASGAAERRHEQNLTAALAAGAFGVPSFVVDDGEVFWGQDRIVLLLHHLAQRQGGSRVLP